MSRTATTKPGSAYALRDAVAIACVLIPATVHAFPGHAAPTRPATVRADAPQRLHAASAMEVGWVFQDGPTTYETIDGLGFMFPDANDRAAKERLIARVREEFHRLVAVVAKAERGGRTVDYDLLEVRASESGDEQRVILVPGGPGVRASLPLLARSPELVALARPWIRARVRGVAYRQVFPRADLLLPGPL